MKQSSVQRVICKRLLAPNCSFSTGSTLSARTFLLVAGPSLTPERSSPSGAPMAVESSLKKALEEPFPLSPSCTTDCACNSVLGNPKIQTVLDTVK